MRLLHARTKKLKTFYGEKIPEYAILSHMWGGEEDEVLFRHVAGSDADKREGEERKGYAKVEGACQQAIEDGWEYIWIDTCCIDKTSSAELSEAINSMYEWYQSSEVCYVYLEDVLSAREDDGDKVWEDDSDEGDSDDRKPVMFPIVPFERGRWFKRGWTLQELIAPRFVVFYSKGWIDIGTKASLRDTISAVTHIRVEMLMSYNPEEASVAEKMSWAAFRETTRVEDVAYCLMGLLGVNMPLLYGEGDRAFRRLQEELMKISDDDSLFAWKSRFNEDYKYLTRRPSGGMLADSPWGFRDGMNIVRSKDGAYSPYSMTNQGLQIKLPLLPIDPNLRRHLVDMSESIFKTILKCTVSDTKPPRRIVIYVRKIREGHYQRIFSHWLDETGTLSETGTPLIETELTSLLVPQASTYTTGYRFFEPSYNVQILPTESGFTIDGHSLVEGYNHFNGLYYDYGVTFFKHQEKCFGVTIGWDWVKDLPWLDFIDVNDEEQSYVNSYEEGGSRAHLRKRYLDRLSEQIPGENWWVTVSVKRTEKYGLLAVIDIQREPIRAKGWYNPSAISTSDSFSGDFSFKYHSVHSDFKQAGHNWIATSNPKVERNLDVSLVYTLPSKSAVYCIQFSPDGKYLATGGMNVTVVQVYDMKTGAEICTLINESNNSKAYIRSICFNPDSKFIATGDSKGCIQIWDIEAKYMHKVLNGHKTTVNYLCFLQNGDFLISGSHDGTVRIWEIPNWTSRILTFPLDHLDSLIGSFAISPNDGLLVAASTSGIVWISDMVTTWQLEGFQKHYEGNVDITFTPDGKGLLGGTNKTLKYWDVSGFVHTGVTEFIILGASSARVERDINKINPPTFTYKEFNDDIVSLAVSHDGHWVISRLQDRHLVFLDLTHDAAPQLVLETAYSSFSSSPFAMSPAGNILAASTGDKMVQVWRYDIKPQGDPSSHIST